MAQREYVRSLETAAEIQARYVADGDRQAALCALLRELRQRTGSAAGLFAQAQACRGGWTLEVPLAVDGQAVAERTKLNLTGEDGEWVGQALAGAAPRVLEAGQALLPEGFLRDRLPSLEPAAPALAVPLPGAAPGALLLLAGRAGGYGRLKLEPLEPLWRCAEPLLQAMFRPAAGAGGANGGASAGNTASGHADGSAVENPQPASAPEPQLAPEDLPLPVLIVQHGRIVHANGPAAALLGLASPAGPSSQAGLAEPVAADAWVEPAQRPGLQALLDGTLAASGAAGAEAAGVATTEPLELTAPLPDGRVATLRVTSRGIRWRGGPAVLLALVDVTGRAQRQAEDQEGLLRAVFDALPHSLVVKDREGRYLLVNATYAKLAGESVSDLIGRHVNELPAFDPQTRERLAAADEEVMRTGRSITLADVRRESRDRAVVWEHVIKSPLRDAAGKLIGVLALALDLTDHVRVEEELRAGRALLRTVLDTIPHSVTVQDREGRLVLVNRAFLARSGIQEQQLLGRPLSEVGFVSETTAVTMERADARVLATRAAVEVLEEPFVRHGEVEAGYRNIFKTPILGADGGVTGIVTLSIDVTGQVESARKLREGRRVLQAVFDTIPHLVSVKDRAGRYTMVNPAYETLLGIKPADLIGRRADEIPQFSGTAGEEIAANDRLVTDGRAAMFRGEQVVRHADGRLVHFDLYKSALHDDQGEISGLFGIAVDVTERKAAERREELALSRLRGAIESHPAMFMLFDDQERLVLWSSRATDQFREMEGRLAEGTRYEEIARLTAGRYVDDDELDAYLAERLAEFRSGNAQGTRLRKDGRWIQFYDHRTEDGGTVSLRYDITDLKTRELELQQAHKMEAVGQLTGGVAHDFNNLLTVMLGNVELLKRYVPPVGKPIQLIERTIAAGERGAALTQRLLSFSRRQTLQPRPTDLNALVQGLHDLLQRAVGESVRMQVRLRPGLWGVNTDPAQLENALLNLVLNARDAMPTGGTLTIETDNALLDGAYARSHNVRAGEYAALTVTDTGVGVPAEVIERVFDPFFTTKEVGRGSGLGLSMVYGFVRQSSGHVRLISEEGQGTTVCMYLPRTVLPVDEPGQAPIGTDVPRGSGELVLIVEDDPHIAILAREMLAGIGYETRTELNAADAIARIEREPEVQVLFSDIVLPGGKSGIELAEAARRLRPELKVLFTTGYAEQEQLSGSLQAHGGLLLVKPYRRMELAEKMYRVLHTGAAAGD